MGEEGTVKNGKGERDLMGWKVNECGWGVEGGCDWMGVAGKKVGNVNLVQTKKMKRNGYNIR